MRRFVKRLYVGFGRFIVREFAKRRQARKAKVILEGLGWWLNPREEQAAFWFFEGELAKTGLPAMVSQLQEILAFIPEIDVRNLSREEILAVQEVGKSSRELLDFIEDKNPTFPMLRVVMERWKTLESSYSQMRQAFTKKK